MFQCYTADDFFTLAVSQPTLFKRGAVLGKLKLLLRDVNSCFHWICLCAMHSHESTKDHLLFALEQGRDVMPVCLLTTSSVGGKE